MTLDLYIAFGANLGSPKDAYKKALELLSESVGPLVQASKLYSTKALSDPNTVADDRPIFSNGVAHFKTVHTPSDILAELHCIEELLGRDRANHTYWASRKIDLDLLSLGNMIVKSENLIIPHPRIQERDFVLYPLQEIAPHWEHPELGIALSQLIEQFKASSFPKTL